MYMETISVTDARSNIYKLIANVIALHKPIQIKGKTGSVVMLSEEDWNAIQETLYLDSIPGMTDSILQGMNESEDKCSKEIKW